MELQDMFWGAYYGSVTDKYGVVDGELHSQITYSPLHQGSISYDICEQNSCQVPLL